MELNKRGNLSKRDDFKAICSTWRRNTHEVNSLMTELDKYIQDFGVLRAKRGGTQSNLSTLKGYLDCSHV